MEPDLQQALETVERWLSKNRFHDDVALSQIYLNATRPVASSIQRVLLECTKVRFLKEIVSRSLPNARES